MNRKHVRLLKKLREERFASKARAALLDALEAYLADYGSDGYDSVTFVDFVVAQIHDPGDSDAMRDFYAERVKERSRAS